MIVLMLTGCAWLFEVPEDWTPEERAAVRQPVKEYVPKKVPMRAPSGGVTTGSLPEPGSGDSGKRARNAIRPVSTKKMMEGAKPLTNSYGIEIKTGRGSAKRSRRGLSGYDAKVREHIIADTEGSLPPPP